MEEADTIPLSALQHWLFCPRQCCLIHVERLWEENRFTAEGRLMHERTDLPGGERRNGVRTLRALPLASERLGIFGTADVVEFHDGIPFPVEYKRGRPKGYRADEVQLCAQAICLEEMTGCTVPHGALFYGKTRRRANIEFDPQLRALTEATAIAVREAVTAGSLPSPVYERTRCDSCSLLDSCRPRLLSTPPSIAKWLKNRLDEDMDV